jgi:hypothetical protein
MMLHLISGKNGNRFHQAQMTPAEQVEAVPDGRTVRVQWKPIDAEAQLQISLRVQDASLEGSVYCGEAEAMSVVVPCAPGAAVLDLPTDAALLDAADAGAHRSTLDRHLRPRTTKLTMHVTVGSAEGEVYPRWSSSWEHLLEESTQTDRQSS